MAVDLNPYIELHCPACGSGPVTGSVRYDRELAELSEEPGETFLIPRDPYESQDLTVEFRCTQGHAVALAAQFEGGAWLVAAESDAAKS
jgi:nitrogen fixation protein FixH